jgi:ankyrin repeat protein
MCIKKLNILPLYLKMSSLIKAVRRGDLKDVKSLTENKADVDIKDHDGYTPLYEASDNGHMDIVKELVKCTNNVQTDINYSDAVNQVLKREIARRAMYTIYLAIETILD